MDEYADIARRMRINSTHTHSDRGLDFYPTPACAIEALIRIERARIPRTIWEPACGDGAIARPLSAAGYEVIATDIVDRGYGVAGVDYLKTAAPHGVDGIITNPPYRMAQEFLAKAIKDAPYSAWLLRMNFVESLSRLPFFRATPPARILVSSRRLPMMHRDGWTGKKSTSNQCHAWFVFERGATQSETRWFDWKEAA